MCRVRRIYPVHSVGITEDGGCFLKRNTVFFKVGYRFGDIPGKRIHVYTLIQSCCSSGSFGRRDRFPSRLESDAAGFRRGRLHELADGFEEGSDLRVMSTNFSFELLQFGCQLFMASGEVAELHECAHDGDVDLNSPFAPQHTESMATPCSVKT